jgi:acyl-CoA synthetase (AMP-forming)/AMP-acid ligase II
VVFKLANPSQSLSRADTFTDLLIERLIADPDGPALTLIEPGQPDRTWTLHQFLAQAQALAAHLTDLGVRAGDVLPIIIPTSPKLLITYWACQLLGAVPTVMPFPNSKIDPQRYYQSLPEMLAHCDVRLILTDDHLQPTLDRLRNPRQIAWRTFVPHLDPAAPDPAPGRYHRPQAENVAILQHSSGTTGLQKGVALRHRDVIRQLDHYSQRIQLHRDDVIVSWLPLYHDMGLIATFVMPILTSVHVVMMSPFDWVANPHMLLDAITRYEGTLVWQPNFAYNFLADRLDDRHLETVRLDSVRGWINCSEPTYPASHRRFLDRFAPFGVTERSLTVSYAMAENTFAVTQSGFEEPQRIDRLDAAKYRAFNRPVPADPDADDVIEILSAGTPLDAHRLVILDEEMKPLSDRAIGQIAVSSDCMMTGYHNRPDLTAGAWHNGFYLTGDLGYLADGHLYVVGRIKDLVIIGGKNVYPNDVEQIVNDTPGILPGRTVVFGVDNPDLGTEDLAIVAECAPDANRSTKDILLDVRARIAAATDVVPRYAKLVDPGWLVKTSSGKFARSANREKFITTFVKTPAAAATA